MTLLETAAELMKGNGFDNTELKSYYEIGGKFLIILRTSNVRFETATIALAGSDKHFSVSYDKHSNQNHINDMINNMSTTNFRKTNVEF